MARLPQPGSDKGTWGDILNDFLTQALNADGTLKDISQAKVTGLAATLSAKVNSADLSAVALSGSYADLSNKPLIPTQASDIGATTSADVDTKIAAQASLDAAQYQTKADALKVVTLTLADYESLSSPDPTTLYLVTS